LTLTSPWRNVFEECCNNSATIDETINNVVNTNINEAKNNNLCPDGFVHNPSLNVCDDIDECENGSSGNDCNPDTEVCRNVVGGFLCEPLEYDDQTNEEQKCPKGDESQKGKQTYKIRFTIKKL
jgi:hypothetical protein